MGMKVCKLVRLTQKDEKGNFANTKEGKITLRKKVVISEESVKETVDNFKSTGLLYVVDETATAARDKVVDAEVEAARNTKTEDTDGQKPGDAEVEAARNTKTEDTDEQKSGDAGDKL